MTAKIIQLSDAKEEAEKAKNSGTKCPQCGASAIKPHTPFCSRRCAQIDLGKWLNEDYRVPADDVMDEGDVESLISALEEDSD